MALSNSGLILQVFILAIAGSNPVGASKIVQIVPNNIPCPGRDPGSNPGRTAKIDYILFGGVVVSTRIYDSRSYLQV